MDRLHRVEGVRSVGASDLALPARRCQGRFLTGNLGADGADALQLGVPQPQRPDGLRFTPRMGADGADALQLGVPQPQRPDGLRFTPRMGADGADALQATLPLRQRPDGRCLTPNVAAPLIAIAMAISLIGASPPALAAVTGNAGPYRVELTTDPAIIPVGKVILTIKIADATGKPVESAHVRSMVKMPSMNMGEKETIAQAVSGKPGLYTTEAGFMMAGSYEATISIQLDRDQVVGKIALETGQDTGTEGPSPLRAMLPWLVVGMIVVFIGVRMRQTGQRVEVRRLASGSAIGGILMLTGIFAIALYAINNWRRPGAMTPIEAQAMEMNTPAPPGSAPVVLAEVTRGPIESVVRYSGQAAGFNEHDVVARTQGWLTWMPLNNGQKVRAGEVVARLDTSQIAPQMAQQQATVSMSRRAVTVMEKEHAKAVEEVKQAHDEAGVLRGALEEARSNVEAAREERAGAESEVAAKQSMIIDAEAMVAAMKADQDFWRQQTTRNKALLDRGALSKEEFQREAAMAANADGKARQAQARLAQAQAEVRAAQATVRKAEAMLRAAESRVRSVTSELQSHSAHIRVSEAAVDAAKAKISEAQAGVTQALGGLAATATARGYAEVRTMIDGVVTQRVAAPGQLLNPGQTILRIAQVDHIRLQANAADADIGAIQIGARVVVRSRDGAKDPLIARITSVPASVDPGSRTGVVEAVVANPNGRIKPGQFLSMEITTGRRASAIRVPVAAVRVRAKTSGGALAAGSASYVLAAEPGSKTDEYTVSPVEVRTGVSDGTFVEIVYGLRAGQKVVVSGGAYLKSGDTVTYSAPLSPVAGTKNEATIVVTSMGFSPPKIALKAGVSVKLTFIRKDEQNCANEVVFPAYGIKRELPLNQPVVIELTPRTGDIAFTCGMNMLSGKMVAR